MATSCDDLFVNIDLDESVILSNSKDDKNHQIDENSSDFSIKDDKENDQPCSSKDVQTNEQLDKIVNKTFQDFTELFRLRPTEQINDLNESIDTLLTHMEEFCGLLELVRNGNNQNLDGLLETIESKIDHCNELFDMIDKLERIVGRVGYEINRMDEEVTKAETMMGSKTTIKKLLSFITNSPQNQQKIRFNPPDIFKTSELMQL